MLLLKSKIANRMRLQLTLASVTGTHKACGKHAHLKGSAIIKLQSSCFAGKTKIPVLPDLMVSQGAGNQDFYVRSPNY